MPAFQVPPYIPPCPACPRAGQQLQLELQQPRKGVPWSQYEHAKFLEGLAALGRGNWRDISRNFVPSRTPTQVRARTRARQPPRRPRPASKGTATLSHTPASPSLPAQVASHAQKHFLRIGNSNRRRSRFSVRFGSARLARSRRSTRSAPRDLLLPLPRPALPRPGACCPS